MKKEYNLRKLKKRTTKVKVSTDAAKVPISIRLPGEILAELRTEASRLGLPYQSFVSSILHRFVNGELVDLKSFNIDRLIKKAS
jgi:predicted DNA binding CopG/RHH family protein